MRTGTSLMVGKPLLGLAQKDSKSPSAESPHCAVGRQLEPGQALRGCVFRKEPGLASESPGHVAFTFTEVCCLVNV